MPDSLTIVRPSIGDQVNSVINNLADKLRVPVSHLYGVLVRQSYTEGVIDLATAVICLIVLIAGLSVVYKAYLLATAPPNNNNNNYRSCGYTEGRITATIFGILASAISFVCLLAFLRSGVSEILNPEYGAIRLIVSALKGGG